MSEKNLLDFIWRIDRDKTKHLEYKRTPFDGDFILLFVFLSQSSFMIQRLFISIFQGLLFLHLHLALINIRPLIKARTSPSIVAQPIETGGPIISVIGVISRRTNCKDPFVLHRFFIGSLGQGEDFGENAQIAFSIRWTTPPPSFPSIWISIKRVEGIIELIFLVVFGSASTRWILSMFFPFSRSRNESQSTNSIRTCFRWGKKVFNRRKFRE